MYYATISVDLVLHHYQCRLSVDLLVLKRCNTISVDEVKIYQYRLGVTLFSVEEV